MPSLIPNGNSTSFSLHPDPEIASSYRLAGVNHTFEPHELNCNYGHHEKFPRAIIADSLQHANLVRSRVLGGGDGLGDLIFQWRQGSTTNKESLPEQTEKG